jgi:two-component system, OmpR family, response regulator
MFNAKSCAMYFALPLTAKDAIAEHARYVHLFPRPWRATDRTISPSRTQGQRVSSGSTPHRALVVEDNADVADAMRLWLELRGLVVEVAADGPSALARAREFQPQVVLCDLGLPGPLDGCDVARAIRDAEASRSIVLIALSGEDGAEARARGAGFDACFAKPVEFSELEATIRRALGR